MEIIQWIVIIFSIGWVINLDSVINKNANYCRTIKNTEVEDLQSQINNLKDQINVLEKKLK